MARGKVGTYTLRSVLNIFGDEPNIVVIVKSMAKETIYKKNNKMDNIPYELEIPKQGSYLNVYYVTLAEETFLKCQIDV